MDEFCILAVWSVVLVVEAWWEMLCLAYILPFCWWFCISARCFFWVRLLLQFWSDSNTRTKSHECWGMEEIDMLLSQTCSCIWHCFYVFHQSLSLANLQDGARYIGSVKCEMVSARWPTHRKHINIYSVLLPRSHCLPHVRAHYTAPTSQRIKPHSYDIVNRGILWT